MRNPNPSRSHMPNDKGMLIVFEGPDGIGKTVLTERLSEHLTKIGLPCAAMSFPGREPGSLGRLVYGLHHDPLSYGIDGMDPTSMQTLHIAAHIDAIERRIRPALNSGTWVVLDRFWWSTLVYGRNLGARVDSLERLVDVERQHWQDIQPARIFLVCRNKPAREGEPLDRHLQLLEGYRGIAARYSRDSRVVEVSTDGSVDESFGSVLAGIPLRG